MSTVEIEPLEGESPEEFMQRTSEAGDQEGESKEAPVETPPAEKVKVGDKEYDPDELTALLQDAERAKEIEKGGREKFEQAAELQKQVEAEKEKLADHLVVFNAWTNGTPEERRMILQELAKAIPGEDIPESTLTENEAAIKRMFEGRISELEGVIRQQKGQLDKIAPMLEDIRTWTGSKKEAEEIDAQIAALKEKGIDASREQLQHWKDNGIADPLKALNVIVPLMGNKGVEKQPDEVPAKTLDNTFDPDDPDMGPDEIAQRIARGEIPSS